MRHHRTTTTTQPTTPQRVYTRRILRNKSNTLQQV
jgi:hypothetical protein